MIRLLGRLVMIAFLVCGGYKLYELNIPKDLHARPCPFCDPEVLARQTCYADDLTAVIYNRLPISDGHTLVIPRRHVERFEDLTDQEILAMGHTIKKTQAAAKKAFDISQYLLIERNGNTVGQTVSHIHFHCMGRRPSEWSMLAWEWRNLTRVFHSPMTPPQLAPFVERMRQAFAAPQMA
jgi:histidine triad (HIT) family protein